MQKNKYPYLQVPYSVSVRCVCSYLEHTCLADKPLRCTGITPIIFLCWAQQLCTHIEQCPRLHWTDPSLLPVDYNKYALVFISVWDSTELTLLCCSVMLSVEYNKSALVLISVCDSKDLTFLCYEFLHCEWYTLTCNVKPCQTYFTTNLIPPEWNTYSHVPHSSIIFLSSVLELSFTILYIFQSLLAPVW